MVHEEVRNHHSERCQAAQQIQRGYAFGILAAARSSDRILRQIGHAPINPALMAKMSVLCKRASEVRKAACGRVADSPAACLRPDLRMHVLRCVASSLNAKPYD